jgi:hypothetical protein
MAPKKPPAEKPQSPGGPTVIDAESTEREDTAVDEPAASLDETERTTISADDDEA